MSHAPAHRDLLCFSHLRWDFVTQRPQHLMKRAARDRRVFYIEEPVFHGGERNTDVAHIEVLSVAEHVWSVRPRLIDQENQDVILSSLVQQLLSEQDIRNYDAWFYTPMACLFTRNLVPHLVVYDCMDELKNFLHAPPQLLELERELLNRADVVFTGGRSLYETKRHSHPCVFAFPSSIDAAHFASATLSTTTDPADQAAIPHPRAGFYGVVDERFDIELLKEVSQRLLDVHFVILGPVVKIDPAMLPQATNIHYLGGKSYDELPAYLSGWEVAMLPFAINDATRYISPTKTPEYLAAGRRVVSTPVRDVVHDYGNPGLVEIAASPEEFAVAIERALHTPSAAWSEKVQRALQQTSWDRTWAAMRQAMEEAEMRASADSRIAAATSGPRSPLERPNAQPSAGLPSTTQSAQRLTKLSPKTTSEFDILIAGAGFAGSVLAERYASQLGKRVLIVDRRDHIAGNAYDHLDEHGVLVHRYGPHIFHTNSSEVVEYLSQFTEWRPYEHRVLANVKGKLVPVPINLHTINQLYGLELDESQMREFLAQRVVPCTNVRTSEDIVLSRVGRDLYESFFRNYTRKQWGLDPRELDAAVAGRIPVRFNTDDRYFSDSFQAMPLGGYTRMFQRMLDHPGITVQLNTNFQEVRTLLPQAHVFFTGPIDEFFDYRYGSLPYRSLEFRHEHHARERYQLASVVNFPNDHEFTRITEFKTLTGQRHSGTSIVYEYPRASGDPYYPIPRPQNTALYARYKALADVTPGVTFCGRLANYKYFNMDQVVAQALLTFKQLASKEIEAIPSAACAWNAVSVSREPALASSRVS